MTEGSAQKHIVVVGAGFGGLTFCQQFGEPNTRITLVDRQNHHLFQPLLYQVASAGLSAPEIAQPIRSILSDKKNVTVLMNEVVDFNLAEKHVQLKEETLSYDYLVLALGGRTSYFGHPEWEKYAPGLKNLSDAMRIRREVLLAFEKAELCKCPKEFAKKMTMVIIGGGPTGVEMAGAFQELAKFVLASDFRRINPREAKVILIEAADRVLATFPPELSESAHKQMVEMGIDVRVKTRVQDITEDYVDIGTEKIYASTKVWAAGVAASPLTAKLGVELDRAGRVKVNPDLSLPGHPEVFAIGDIASVTDAKSGKPVPGVAPAAIQMAQYAERVISKEIRNGIAPEKREAFHYWDKGTMATIGRSRAVAMIGALRFSRFFAWIAWAGIHLLFLVGLRNKMSVLFKWTYAYFTYKQGARVVVEAKE